MTAKTKNTVAKIAPAPQGYNPQPMFIVGVKSGGDIAVEGTYCAPYKSFLAAKAAAPKDASNIREMEEIGENEIYILQVVAVGTVTQVEWK